MNKFVVLAMLLSTSGTIYAEDQVEGKSKEVVALCTDQGKEYGLSGEDLDAYINECVSSQTGEKDES